MSDTPRTDAAEPCIKSDRGGWVRADFARELERELAKKDAAYAAAYFAWREENAALRSEIAYLRKWKTEREEAERASLDF